MIGLADPRGPLDRTLLDAPGGFAWWYMDAVDEQANGCVLIWSFGLPFLPGRESSARSGRPRLPRLDPSLNVAVYRGGKTALYLLQRHDEQGAVWEPGTERMRIGRSVLESRLIGERRQAVAELDVDLPGGSTLTGTVRIEGPVCQVPDGIPGDERHQWTPLCTASTARLDLQVDGRPFLQTCGRGYHDRNGSTERLGALGIRDWLWGRSPCGDGERIWYLLWPEEGEPHAWGLEIDASGRVTLREQLGVERLDRRLATFGMPWYRRLRLTLDGRPWLDVEHDTLVDDGFFYLRWLTRTRGPEGQVGRGVAEGIRPGRVDRGWNRWLVDMAVHKTASRNSPFLRLFAGVRGRAPELPAPVEAASEHTP